MQYLATMPWGISLLTDDQCYATAEYETENFILLEQVLRSLPKRLGPSPVFLDIGAHQGMHTTFLAHLAGEKGLVYAFEPHPTNLRYLLYNTSFKRGRAPVIVHPFAVGSEDGIDKLNCWWPERPISTGLPQLVKGGEPSDYQLEIVVHRLDSLALPKVDFLKIDVEHWEWEVIQGAKELLLRDRPILLVEIHNTDARQQIMAFCQKHDFVYEQRTATVASICTVSEYLFIRPSG